MRYPLRDLSKYEYLGTHTVLRIDPDNAVILDKPFAGRPGDFIHGDGDKLEIGAEVTAWRKRELIGSERESN